MADKLGFIMLDTTQLRTFAAVVREGSFEAAAHALHVTPSAVSQRMKALEQAVGQVLVRRTKPCQATDAGRPLLRLAGQVALLEREALDAARPPTTGAAGTRSAPGSSARWRGCPPSWRSCSTYAGTTRTTRRS
jgi:LysR family transcriptional regulator (chromosome initiation inhibitor)